MQKYELLLTGFLGSLVYTLLTKLLSFKQKVIYVFCGTVTTYYVSPVLFHYASIEIEEVQLGVAFVCGYAGAELMRISIQAIAQYLPETIKKKLGVN